MSPGLQATTGLAGNPVGDAVNQAGGIRIPGSAKYKDTKFGKLLKVVAPMVQGGLIGGFGGNWRVPGSGFQAANEFYTRRAQLALEKQRIAAQQALQQSEVAWRQSEATRNDFYDRYLQSRWEREQNAGGKSATDRIEAVPGYSGKYFYPSGSHGAATYPFMSDQPTQAQGASSIIGGGSNVTSSGVKSPIPLGPPDVQLEREKKDTKPHPTPEISTDANGISTTRYRDTNPDSRGYMSLLPEGGPEVTRHPVPTAGQREGTKLDKSTQAAVERVAEESLNIDGDVDKAIARIDSNPRIPPEYKAAARAAIGDIVKNRKPKAGRFDLNQMFQKNPALKKKLESVPDGQ